MTMERNEENKLRFEQIIQEIKYLFPDTTTVLKVVITAEKTTVEQTHRYPEDLRKSNISMRNIKGNFIKDLKNP